MQGELIYLTMTDLNGDGILDLVASDGYDAAYLLGNGDGTFQSEQHFTLAGPAPKAVALTDFNADGQPDLVFADQGDQSGTNGFVVALENAFPRLSVAPADPTLTASQTQQFNGYGILRYEHGGYLVIESASRHGLARGALHRARLHRHAASRDCDSDQRVQHQLHGQRDDHAHAAPPNTN